MKKIICFLIFIGIISLGIYLYINNDITSLLKIVEKEKFTINNYSIFGTHFNIEGCIDKILSNNSKLVLKNKNEEIILDSIFKTDNNTCFKTSENNNDSIYLEDLKKGNYLLLVNDQDKYYTLVNNTSYSNLEYYTILNNKKINMIFNNDYVEFKIIDSNKPDDVYDITIDPGHGGKDIGASYKLEGKTYYESNITLEISLKLKQELEKLGLKVKLTRDKDIYLNNYGDYGRANIPNDNKSKYSISIHLNSTDGIMKYGGVEVYTPNNINYELASNIAKNISTIVGYSKKPSYKIEDGVYYTYFTKKDIEESSLEMKEKKLKEYDIKIGAPYMFMIREVGGINTYAYVDGRNSEHGKNEYYNSNQTAEPYLIELGYINYKDNLIKFINNPDSFALEISKSIKDYLSIS